MLKVLLIRPYMLFPRVAREYFTILPPKGLGYIAAVLEKAGHEVSILDAFGAGWKKAADFDRELIRVGLDDGEITERVRACRPDVVGISNPFSSQSEGMEGAARLVKKVDGNIKVVVGGVHPSSVPLECMKDGNIDYLVRGEGEYPMLELLEHLEGKRPMDAVKGVYYRFGGRVCFNGPGNVIKDLDELPLPSYHLMPMDTYFEASMHDMTVRGGFHDRWVHIITSRGCPYLCNFCSVYLMEGRKWRYRSKDNVVDEMQFLHDKYGVRRFTIEDSNFTLREERAGQICDEIIRRGLKVSWQLPNGLRADKINPTLLDKMKRAGCMEITIAVEHGDQEFLTRVIKKNMDLGRLEQSVKEIRTAGMPVSGFFIVGIPPETRETAGKTLDMVRRLARQGMVPLVNVAMPLPGTELYDTCVKKGYIPADLTYRDYLLMGHSKPLITTEFLRPDDLLELRRKIYLTGLVNLLLFHPILFLRLPFVKATLSDMANPRTFLKRARKIAGLFFPERLGG